MKEELQSKLVEILTSIQTATGKAGEFAMEQLPEIAQSYVAYGRVSSIVGILIGLALLAVAAAFLKWVYGLNVKAAKFDEPMGLNIFGGIGAALVAVGGVTILGGSVQSALLVWFAPKVWLLKELATLVK